ncbi:MAG: Wzz/FepE/Etk N-terminal domain-containing protein [Crocinitomicaceae bacterium]
MENNNLNLNEERNNLFQFIWSNRKQLLIFTGAAFVISVIVSLLITPLYLSTAIVFPAASSNVSFSEQRNVKAAAMDFGEEEQAEQLVQILQSARIKDRVVEKYNLLNHYEIDSDDPNKNYKLTQEYNSHFTFTRTRYGSIQIDVLDKDPKLAAKMANDIVDLIDTVKNEMINERTRPAFEINKRKLFQLQHERDSIVQILDSLSNLGVVPLDMRSNLFQALVDSKSPNEKTELQNKIETNKKFGSVFDALEYRRNEMIVKIEEFRVSYEQAESDANSNFTHKFIVERAVVADRKEKPKRMIIVLVSVISGLIFGVFFLLIKQRLKELKLSA